MVTARFALTIVLSPDDFPAGGWGDVFAHKLAARPALYALAIGLAVLAGHGAPGRAQSVSPSQVTPPSLRPPPAPAGRGPVVRRPPPLTPPAGNESLTVVVDDVQVEGTFPALSAKTATVVAGIRGKPLTVKQIYAFATSLEQAYGRTGYALARVVVPPQHLVDHGRLRLVVVDGFIQSIEVDGVPGRVRHVIAARLDGLRNRRHVTLGEIERALLIAGDVPGVTLRSTLAPGTGEGGTRLIVEGKQRLVTGSFGVDNRLPDSLGTWQYSANLAVNSPFGFGEQFYVSLGLGADLQRAIAGTTPLRILGGGVVVPLGVSGITVNPEYTNTRTLTVPMPGAIPSAGQYERYALRLADPVIRSRKTDLTLQASLEHITEQSSVPKLAVDLSRDRYTAIRLGPDVSTTLLEGTQLQAGLTVTRGLGGRGAAAAQATGLSRAGAAPDFTKVNASVHLSQRLPAGFSADLFAQGQSSLGHAMLQAEQFSLTGVNAVSAYADGTFDVDQGGTVRGELGHPLTVTAGRHNVAGAPYLFAAAGHGQVVRATQAEQPVINTEAVGLGARVAVPATGVTPDTNLGVEVARQFSDDRRAPHGWRSNFSLLLTF